jgi:hypothetical protein
MLIVKKISDGVFNFCESSNGILYDGDVYGGSSVKLSFLNETLLVDVVTGERENYQLNEIFYDDQGSIIGFASINEFMQWLRDAGFTGDFNSPSGGGATSGGQEITNDNLSQIKANTLDIPNVIAEEGGSQPTKGLVVMGHTGAGVVRHISVDNAGVQVVRVNTSALPTGASTSALQTTGNTSLNSIDNKLNTDANGNLKINQTATTFTYSPNNSTNGNSSVFALANSATWNGTIENAINQPYLIFGVMSDRNVTITLSQFLNASGTIQDVPAKTFTVTAGVPFSTSVAILGNYVRLSVNNSSGASANLYVDSYYGLLPVQADSLTQFGNFKSAISEVGGVAVPATGILVTGRTGQPTATPTVTSASAYTAGNLVGGLMTFTNCFASGLTSGVLQSILIRFRSVQSATFKLYLFSQQPTNTVWTDRTAPNINALDLPFLIDVFLFASPDSGLGTMTIYTQDGLGASIANTANGQNLWGLLVTTGTPTFSSTSDVSVTLGILQD